MAAGGTVLRLVDGSAKCLINIAGAWGATIDGLGFDGARLGKGVHGIFLDKPDYGKREDCFRIERCQVARFTGDGVSLAHAWCFSVRHSMLVITRETACAYADGTGSSATTGFPETRARALARATRMLP